MAQPTDTDCIFCKIVAGDIPCHKLFENDAVLAFLDVNPLARGHALVIPKGHWAILDEVEDDAARQCITTAKTLAPIVTELTGAAGWNLLQNNGKVAGQEVGHVHFHLIPRVADDGLGYRWNAGSIDHVQAGAMAADIASRMQR